MIINKDIDNAKGFDWGCVSEDYARYRDIYPEIFYEKIIEMGLCAKGQKVLDLGTGTGVLPRNLYNYGARFIGSDVSENQIEQARRLSEAADMDISYIVSPAEAVDFPDGFFDAVTACQCYEYFDKRIIFSKVNKILKENGHFCILFMAWLPDESEIAYNTEKLVLKYNPHWTGKGMKRFTYDFPEEAQGLFEICNSFYYDVPIRFTRES